MSSLEKEQFAKAQKSLTFLREVDNPNVLDTLIDYWKWKNYSEQLKLTSKEKEIMFTTMKLRSRWNVTARYGDEDVSDSIYVQRPDAGHGFNKLSLAGGEEIQSLSIRYGFHDFFDTQIGHDNSSYIKFFDIQLTKVGQEVYQKIDIVDILSLQNFNWHLPRISWRVKLDYCDDEKIKTSSLLAGGGISFRSFESSLYTLLTLRGGGKDEDHQSLLKPGLNIGYKQQVGGNRVENIFFVGEYFGEFLEQNNKIVEKYKVGISYYKKQITYSLFRESSFNRENIIFEYGLNF